MNQLNDIKHHILNSNFVEKIIYANIFVFIIVLLFPSFMVQAFSLPPTLNELQAKPWSLFSYAFIHVRFFHLLSNLIVLYYMGNLFLDFFSAKKFLIYYALGLLIGGVFFIAYYEITNKTASFPLGGASAAVTAIIVGLATKIPHYSIKLRFIGSVEIWVLAAVWVGISAFGAMGVNAGSGVAHLGGAFLGFVLTAYFKEAVNLEAIFKRKPKPKPNPFQKVYKNKNPIKTKPSHSKKKQNQQKVDAILDKISKSGYDALSKEEKDFLFNQKEH